MITLSPNETVLKIFRKHWLTIVSDFLMTIVLTITPFIIYIVIQIFYPFSLGELGNNILGLLGGLWLLIMWIYFFIIWTDYILDTWILTNQRLVDVEQLGLFNRRVSTLSLDRIQDITVEQNGIIDTAFSMGQVFIQTAGTNEQFKIPSAANPTMIKDAIMQAYQSSKNPS